MPYTEILLPQTYVADPGGLDFRIDSFEPGSCYANENPGLAVAAFLQNDSPLVPYFGGHYPTGMNYGRYWLQGVVKRGNGRFVMSNPVTVGVVQSIQVRLLKTYWGGAADFWLRMWTHGILYEIHTGTYVGQSLYPPGLGWAIYNHEWPLNPFSTALWTLAEVQDVDAGFRLFAAPLSAQYADQVLIIVTYSKIEPTAATQAASGVTPSQATLNGTLIDAGGEVCTLFFQWGDSPSLGNTVAAGTGGTGASFSAPIAGLLAGKNYYFRAGATNSCGTSYGAILSLTSMTPPPGEAVTVLTLPAVEVTENGAKLRGLVQDSLGRYGEVRFEWGGTTAYGNTTPWESGYKSGDFFEARLLSLAEGAVYHFRAQFRGSGIVSGSDAAFSTLSGLGAITFVDEETLSKLEGL